MPNVAPPAVSFGYVHRMCLCTDTYIPHEAEETEAKALVNVVFTAHLAWNHCKAVMQCCKSEIIVHVNGDEDVTVRTS